MSARRLLLLTLALLLLATTALAKPKSPPEVRQGDFAYQQLALGAPESDIIKLLGEPLFTNERNVYGVHVNYYTYKRVEVGVAMKSGEVADIVIKDRYYSPRDNVRYGATPHKLEKTYGQQPRRFLEGFTCYVYDNPTDAHQRLVFQLMDNHLQQWRVTSLPLTDDEANRWEDEEWQSRDLNAHLLLDKPIEIDRDVAREWNVTERKQ